MTDAQKVAEGLGLNIRQVVRSLSGEYAPPPRSQTRQLTASAATRHPELIEREWQDGCASCTYYRLTPLGLDVRAILQEKADAQKAYPTEICHDCGNKYGRTLAGHCATFYPGTCGWCGLPKIVTEPRDYGYPRYD